MPSTYSPLLRFELQATGENPNTWGIINNTQIGSLIEQAIAGLQAVVLPDADSTLTALQGSVDQSRAAFLSFSGPLTVQRAVRVPAVSKGYIIRNASPQPIEVRTVANPGVVVPAGGITPVWCDGAFVRPSATAMPSMAIAGAITAGSLDAATVLQGGGPVWSPGDVKTSMVNVAPAGWLICFGQAVSRTTFAALFAAIGVTFGAGDGSTTFNLPDARGRGLIGLDNLGGVAAGRLPAALALGWAGGDATHLLATPEMPLHGHNINDPGHGHAISDPGHAHGLSDPGHVHSMIVVVGNVGGDNAALAVGNSAAVENPTSRIFTNGATTGISMFGATTGVFANAALTGISIQSNGGNAAHNNVQPSLGAVLLIKT